VTFHITARRYLPPDIYNPKYVQQVTELTATTNNAIQQQQPVTFGEVKASPLEAWLGPEGSRRLRLSDFKAIGT
jgi:hypothetical protein